MTRQKFLCFAIALLFLVGLMPQFVGANVVCDTGNVSVNVGNAPDIKPGDTAQTARIEFREDNSGVLQDGDTIRLELTDSDLQWATPQSSWITQGSYSLRANIVRTSSRVLEITITHESYYADSLYVRPSIKVDSDADDGSVRCDISSTSSALPDKTVTIAYINGNGNVTVSVGSTPDIEPGNTAQTARIEFREDQAGVLQDGDTIRLELTDSDLQWATPQSSWITQGSYSLRANIVRTSSRVLEITITHESYYADSLYVRPSIKVDSDADNGSVRCDISSTSSALPDKTVTIAYINDNGNGNGNVTVSVGSTPDIEPGNTAQAARIEFREDNSGVLQDGDTIRLELTDSDLQWATPQSSWITQGSYSLRASIVRTSSRVLEITITHESYYADSLYVRPSIKVDSDADNGSVRCDISSTSSALPDKTATIAYINDNGNDYRYGSGDITVTAGSAPEILPNDICQTARIEFREDNSGALQDGNTIRLELTSNDVQWDTPWSSWITQGSYGLRANIVRTSNRVLTVTITNESYSADTLYIHPTIRVAGNAQVGWVKCDAKLGASTVTLSIAKIVNNNYIYPTPVSPPVIYPSPTPAVNNRVAIFTLGSKTFTVNGEANYMDAVPYLKNNRIYLPVRYVCDSLGITVLSWDGKNVTLSNGGTQVVITVGSKIMLSNGNKVNLDVAPEIVKPGRVTLPYRWIAEAFGATVTWDNNTRTVKIEQT